MRGRDIFRIVYWVFLVVAPVFLFVNYLSHHNTYPDFAKDGTADIRYYNLRSIDVLPLYGEWEFYPDQLLYPSDFAENKVPSEYIKVPSSWGSKGRYKRFGYATYRLNVIHQNKSDNLSFYYDGIFTSASVFIDGELLSTQGHVDVHRNDGIPELKEEAVTFVPQSDTTEIIIQVSNYHFRTGGITGKLLLGNSRTVNIMLGNRILMVTFLLGGLIIIAFFQLGMAVLPRSGSVYYLFAIVCAILALRLLVMLDSPLYMITEIPYFHRLRLEYLTLFLGVPMISAILHGFFPNDYKAFWVILFGGLGALFSVVQYFVSSEFASWMIPVFQVITFIQGIIISGYLVTVLIRKRPDARMFFLGWVVILLGLTHDIMETSGIFNHDIQLTPFLMFLFIFVQANMVARRSSNAFVQVEDLSDRLNFLNHNLEKMITERTHRIEKQNVELERQSRKIDAQNVELKKTVGSRNQVLTIIGHDLRGPMGNITEMIDLLLSPDIDGETQQQILMAIRQSANSSFTLLENLMYWGRAQSGKISYSPDRYSIREIVGESLNLLESAAREKNIVLENFVPPDHMAWCDYSHVNLIIRNIVNNAIKFTPNGGKVMVSSRLKTRDATHKDYIEILVRDNGIGIEKQRLEKIFSNEHIESTWGTNNEKGSGIGLPLVKEFVAVNKGHIYARSKPGEFTTFFVSLPTTETY